MLLAHKKYDVRKLHGRSQANAVFLRNGSNKHDSILNALGAAGNLPQPNLSYSGAPNSGAFRNVSAQMELSQKSATSQ